MHVYQLHHPVAGLGRWLTRIRQWPRSIAFSHLIVGLLAIAFTFSHEAKGQTLTVSITPQSTTYTPGQSVTITFSGGTNGRAYTLQFFEPSDVSFSNPIAPFNEANNGYTWDNSTPSYSFTGTIHNAISPNTELIADVAANLYAASDFGDSGSFTIVAANTSTPCASTYANITVSGFTGGSSQDINGTLTYVDSYTNNTPRWTTGSTSSGIYHVQWSGTRWEIIDNAGPYLYAYNTTGSSTNLPCSGWIYVNAYFGTPTLSGGCGTLSPSASNGPSVTIAATPSLTLTSGGSVTLTASGADSYTWSNGSTNNPLVLSNLTSATTLSLTGITGQCSASASATLSVTLPAPNLTASTSVVCAGTPISVTASCPIGTASFTAVPSAGSASGNVFTFDGATPDGVYALSATCLDNGLSSTVTSLATNLTIAAGTSITTQPSVSSVVCVGVPVSVPVSVTGSALSQQWYKDGSPVASQTATTLSLPAATTADSGNYRLVIQTTACGSLTSNAFSLSVGESVGITQQPATSSGVCAGVSVSVPISATGAPATYQWYKNGTTVTGQTTATLNLPATALTDVGTYSLVVTGGCNSVTSTGFSLSVNAAPTVGISPSTVQLTTGGSATLTASGASSYTWSTSANGNAITVSPTQTTVYSVTGSSNGCTATASATVTVGCAQPVQADAISVTQTAVLGPNNCSVTLLGAGYGTGYTITGPERSDASGYVFSAVYRKVGYYTLRALDVKRPGTYTFTVVYADACGERSRDTMTYVVTGTACQ